MSMWSDTEQVPCPACDDAPRGYKWLCPLCRGAGSVSQAKAVEYCGNLIAEAQGALDRATAKLKEAMFR